MTTTQSVAQKTTSGAFLLHDADPLHTFTPEDLTPEHQAIAKTAEEFFNNEILPNLEALQHQETGLGARLLRKSAELGLTAIAIPERFGGLEMDLPTSIVAAEQLARDASYAGWHGAHTGIGTLPLLYFGTEAQKEKYLSKLATAEMIAAYALSEPQAGSDALATRTRADLSADGTHYVLSGQKMWITNGGYADLFTIFAKMDGDKFTAFLVERSFPGFSSGAEEKKMGIKGSSTTALFLDNVKVPVENVLGEVGRGHIIAFNILNLGRLKLGAVAAAGAKNVLAVSLQYAQQRKAFGVPIAEFGAIQHKLAEMAIRIYAAESSSWRVVGLIDPNLKSIEEFSVECCIVKVFGSETLDYVADEGVQIHGGYGFHQDYAVERYYRDSRINRIFEGTNEINRLLIPGMLLKRASRGQFPLNEAVQSLMRDVQNGKIGSDAQDEETRLVQNARNIALCTFGMAYQKYQAGIEKQQEVMMYLADIVIELFAMESTLLRTRKLGAKSAIAADMCAVFLRDAMARIEISARNVLGVCSPTELLRTHMSLLRKLAVYDPVDAVALRCKIVQRLLAKGRYSVA
jgi:alkylation response protein AidB-like acyl-CoA dehydrogenase